MTVFIGHRPAIRERFARLKRAFAISFASLICIIAATLTAGPALALDPIVVSPDQDRVEITSLGQLYEGRGDSLQIETAAGPDGAVGRMSVRAVLASTNPNWIVFALTNPTDKAIERWVAADRYTITGSGAVWPDLDARRIEAITPSIGFVPERIKNDRADVFRITLEPGQTITYVAELSSDRFARIFLWKPLDYELKARDKLVFQGVLLGLTGLLAVFLTAIFAANHKLVFPASALVAWCALGYLCVDFGFFHKLFQLKPEDNAVYRAAAESALAASLVIFLYVFLRLALWHGLIRMLVTVWMLAQLALIAVAIIDPRLAATFARVSFVFLGLVGAGFVMFLAARGQDRAVSLVPTWILFNVWVFAAAVVLTGRLTNEMAVSGLAGGLVLILLLIGFSVTQYAFRTVDPVYGGSASETQLKSLALDATGTSVWEWNARRDEINAGTHTETALGLAPGELNGKTEEFIKHIHEADADRFRLVLMGTRERNGGEIVISVRLRHADNSYRWFEIEAASVPGEDPKALKCVGLIRDVTDARRAHDRLVRDAVNCSLTGLPHRELLLDRLGGALRRARTEPNIRPTLITVGIDKFKSINASYGAMVGDSLILTVARRLQRHIGENDTLARVGGDQFCILLQSEQTSQDIAALAERIRRSLRSPITMAGREIVLTASLGIATYDRQEDTASGMLNASESALYEAKRSGTDRVEVFKPSARGDSESQAAAALSELRKAIERNQIRIFYQPVVYLPTEELAGFEALVRWDHPKLGLIDPLTFEPAAADTGLMAALSTLVLTRAARDAAVWQKELPRPDMPLFVSVGIIHSQAMRDEFATEVRQLITRSELAKKTLRIEISEGLMMENPEQASAMLEQLQGTGACLTLDDFGAGYSSLPYLHKFQFATLKIDRSMIQGNLAADSSGSAVVRSLVSLTHGLGRTAWADGVETPEGASFLRGLGCEFGQGFYFGGLILDRDVPQLLKAIRKSESKLQPRSFFRSKNKQKKTDAPNVEASAAASPPAPAAQPATNTQARAANGTANHAPEMAPRQPQQHPHQPAPPAPFMGAPANGTDHNGYEGHAPGPAMMRPPQNPEPPPGSPLIQQLEPNPLIATDAPANPAARARPFMTNEQAPPFIAPQQAPPPLPAVIPDPQPVQMAMAPIGNPQVDRSPEPLPAYAAPPPPTMTQADLTGALAASLAGPELEESPMPAVPMMEPGQAPPQPSYTVPNLQPAANSGQSFGPNFGPTFGNGIAHMPTTPNLAPGSANLAPGTANVAPGTGNVAPNANGAPPTHLPEQNGTPAGSHMAPANGNHPPLPQVAAPVVVRMPPRAPQAPAPDLSRLPPSVANSLARLAGGRPNSPPPMPPKRDGE